MSYGLLRTCDWLYNDLKRDEVEKEEEFDKETVEEEDEEDFADDLSVDQDYENE